MIARHARAAQPGLGHGGLLRCGRSVCTVRGLVSEAEKREPNDANAMALATVDPDGLPNVRMVLLKGFDEAGFVFYTNYESAEGA